MHSNDVRTFFVGQDGVIEQFSADRVAYAPSLSQPIPPLATSTDLAAKTPTGRTYKVEKLLNQQLNNEDSTEFLDKWFAYRTPAWEPRSHIPDELVSRYLTRARQRPGRRLTSFLGAGNSS